MIGHSEFPGRSYDEWLEAHYYDHPDPDCDHQDYDVDFNGVAVCATCSQRWTLTAEQLARYDRAEQEAEAAWEAEQRRERSPLRRAWRRLKARIVRFINGLDDLDDHGEIPF